MLTDPPADAVATSGADGAAPETVWVSERSFRDPMQCPSGWRRFLVSLPCGDGDRDYRLILGPGPDEIWLNRMRFAGVKFTQYTLKQARAWMWPV